MRFPALAIAFSFATGILVGGRLAPTLPRASVVAVAFSAALLLLAAVVLRKSLTVACFASLLAWGFLGAAAIRFEQAAVPSNHITNLIAANRVDVSQPLRWQGRLRSDPLRLPWGIRYEVGLHRVQSMGNWMPVSGGLRADYFFDERSKEPPPALRAGDDVELLLRARLVRNFADPGAIDERALMAYQDIHVTGSLRNTSLIQKIASSPPTLTERLARARGRLLNEADLMLAASPDGTAVVRAMLLGDRSFLDSQQVEAFRDTGVYHVLVLAGLHVGVLAAALLWFGRKFRLPITVRVLGTMAGLAAYVGVVQDRPPIVRAAMTAAAYLFGQLLFRRAHLLNAVGVVALLILLARPSEVRDASFQLSLLAVGLIAGIAAPWLEGATEPYLRALDHLGDVTRDSGHPPRAAQFRLDARAIVNWLTVRFPQRLSGLASGIVQIPCRTGLRIWELIVITVVLQIGMLPLMAQYFHRISLAGFGANLPAVLLTGVIVPLGFSALGVSLVWSKAGTFLGHVLSFVVSVLLWSVNRFARIPRASFRVPSPPVILTMAFFAAGLLCASAILAKKRWIARGAGAVVLGMAVLIAAHPFAPRLNPGRLEITVLDIGQGDSIFVAFPDGKTMLVDAGGLAGGAYIRGSRPGIDIGEDVVSPYLWSRGITHLDVVALTHAHEDHYGGMASVLRNFRVGELWLGHDAESAGYRALLDEARTLNLRIVHRAKGDAFDWGGVHIDVLWPADDAPVRTASNNDSLVLRLIDGQQTMLLTGDIESPIERTLTADGNPLHADFLKVPHHGSKTSSTQALLDAVHPTSAVISVGEDNAFGQPNPDVLDRLQQEGARVFRTDRDGAVTALTDGRQMTIRSFLDPP